MPIVTEDGTEEWYINKIVNACRQGRGVQYLVHYEGYGKKHDKWCPGSEMADTDALNWWEDEMGWRSETHTIFSSGEECKSAPTQTHNIYQH